MTPGTPPAGARGKGGPSPILRTKLAVPAQAAWISRPRLIELLQQGSDRPLILASAPAGYGKTTLIAQWARTRRRPHPWVTLDRRDGDPYRFLRHLVAAVPEHAEELSPWLERPQGPGYLLDAFEAWIEIARLRRRTIRIVLDDYHQVAEPRIHEAVEFAIEAAGGLRFLISTRTDPPFPLARWRVEERVTEIRGDDLRFRDDEVDSYLAAELDPALPAELAKRSREIFAARTEGWIAGLKLACLSVRGAADPGAVVEGFSGTDRQVLDYLADEVLAHLDEESHAFLRHLSILDAVSGSLAERVTGLDRGQERIEALERANLFILPLDRHRQWFRVHPLLDDLLRERLARHEAELLPVLHSRASIWFEENGEVEDAAAHSLAAGEFSRAARLLAPVLARVWSRGHISTVAHWIGQFPPGMVDANAGLSLYAAWSAFLGGELATCGRHLEALAAHPAEDPRLRAHETVLRAHILRVRGDPEGATRAAQEAFESGAPDGAAVRAMARLTTAMALTDLGAIGEAHRFAEESLEGARAGESPFTALVARMAIARTHFFAGRLTHAEELCRRAIAESQAAVPYDPVAAFVTLAAIHRERDELPSAAEVLARGEALAERNGRARILPDAALERARLAEAMGDRDRADAALVAAEEVAYGTANENERRRVEAWRARFALARGDTDRAEAWAREAGNPLALPVDPRREDAALTLVRLRLARGEPAGLMAFLAESTGRAERDGRTRSRLELELLAARVRRAEGHLDQALIVFLRVLSGAAPERYVRLFVDEGVEAEDLVRRARGRGEELAACDRILEAFERARAEGAGPALAEPLSRREREVLVRLETGLSNREIAQSLHVSEATVKTHVNRVYRKLGVKSRTQAIALARDLRIIG